MGGRSLGLSAAGTEGSEVLPEVPGGGPGRVRCLHCEEQEGPGALCPGAEGGGPLPSESGAQEGGRARDRDFTVICLGHGTIYPRIHV